MPPPQPLCAPLLNYIKNLKNLTGNEGGLYLCGPFLPGSHPLPWNVLGLIIFLIFFRSEEKTEKVLEEELQNCSMLLELEPDSKWTRYAKVLIMKALDPEKHHQVCNVTAFAPQLANCPKSLMDLFCSASLRPSLLTAFVKSLA